MKVYGKPPLPPPGKVKSLKLNATGRTTMSGLGGQRRATSLADISQSPSTTAPFSEAGQVDSRRKQSAPAILSCVVKANAKVIHHPKPKPRSASTLPTRRTSGTPAQPHHHHSLSNSSNSTPNHKSYAQLGTVTGTRLTGTRSLDRPSPSPEFLRPMSLELREEGDDDVLELDSPPPPPFLGRAKLGVEDEFLLSKSDELCREVLSLCQGRQFQAQAQLSPSYFSSPKYGGMGDGFDLDLSGEPLSSLPCLSLISSLESTPLPTARATPPPHPTFPAPLPVTTSQVITEDGEKRLDLVVGGPAQTPSPEYDYKKVFGILRMIEEEEAKGNAEIASSFGEFLREKVIGGGGGSPTRSCPSFPLAGSSCPPPSRPGTAGSLFPHQMSPGRPISAQSSPSIIPGTETPRPTSRPEIHFPGTSVKDQEGGQGSHSFPRYDASSSVEWGDAAEKIPLSSRSSLMSEPWETTDRKTKNLLSFLDEVEQSDRDLLFNLKFDSQSPPRLSASHHCPQSHVSIRNDGRGLLGHPSSSKSSAELTTASKLDTLIRKGSAELARDLMMLERQVEDSAHNIRVLEETLLSQRELNIRNMKSSEKEMKKRLEIQQEEFELTLSRHQAFLDQIINEKRALQEKCEKVLKESKVTEEKYQGQIKSLQEKHLDEIKRLRKVQENAEKNKKQQWVGQKTQEIRDMTVKGLEPEVQRLIQRHQQEMAETRAYYADEIQEIEERYARKQTAQLQELRETFHREKEEACRRERDLLQKRFDSELQRQAEDFETQKRRLGKEIQEEKERLGLEETRIREAAQENVRKGQIKCEVEVDNVRQEHELKLSNMEKRHEKEIQSLRDNFESQRENWIVTMNKKNEQILQDRESRLIETLNQEKEKEGREREKKVKDEYERIRKEEESVQEARIKRLQDKFQSELEDLETAERELKTKFSSVKSELIAKEEEVFSLRTTLGLKTKENQDLSASNLQMAEERIHLTSIIRREFTTQIEALEEDCKAVKQGVVELKAKHKMELEAHHLELEKLRAEKDSEMEKIGLRVKQTLKQKEETLIELGKQLEKSSIRVNHLEGLLEQQRKDFVKSMTSHPAPASKKK